jgi:hypothetical protein
MRVVWLLWIVRWWPSGSRTLAAPCGDRSTFGAAWTASRFDFGDQMSGSVWLQDIAVLDGTLVVFG